MGGGNLIIGYDDGDAAVKTGWHNIVNGDGHSYESFAGAYSSSLGGITMDVDEITVATVVADRVEADRVVADKLAGFDVTGPVEFLDHVVFSDVVTVEEEDFRIGVLSLDSYIRCSTMFC